MATIVRKNCFLFQVEIKKKCYKILFSKELTVLLKFIYSEKATKFCEISTGDLSYVVPVKSTLEILQNFTVFSEYINFKIHYMRLVT